MCCGSILFLMSSELRLIKWVRYIEQNCIVKWVIFFARFWWLWDFLLKNLKLKKSLMISTGTCGQIWKRCMLEIIFSKKEFQMWDFESFIFWSKFRCFGYCFRTFQSVFFFLILRRRPTMVADMSCWKHRWMIRFTSRWF